MCAEFTQISSTMLVKIFEQAALVFGLLEANMHLQT